MAVTSPEHCWQVDPQVGFPVSGNEDCLYLNVYRPVVEQKKPLPVLVFIHGGGFYSGTNNPLLYGPDYFMETGEVILVCPTYRSNAFGFLATGDEASPGNYGLKDQTMALRWVRDNVAAFGGDPESVTLMGHSAGSVSVNYHLISKLSEGLFKNAILLSGVIDAKWGLPLKDPREFVNRHAAAAGIEQPEKLTSLELVEKLRKVPAKDLVEASQALKDWDILPVTNYVPAVEPEGTEGAFLTRNPREVLETGDFKQVPVLTDILANDGINFVQPLLTAGEKYQEFNEKIYKVLPLILYMDGENPKMKEIVDLVRFKYLGETGLVEGEDGLARMQKMATDYFYGKPLIWLVEQLVKKNEQPAFVSQVTYEGQHSLGPMYTRFPRPYKACHGDELIQLFRMPMIYPENQLSADDKQAQAAILRHILDFAKNDTPGYEQWKKDQPKMAVFSNDRKSRAIAKDVVDVDTELFNCKFWEEVEKLYSEGSALQARMSG